jgi:hypothetical protein
MKRAIWLPLVVLVLASLACSAFGAAERAVEIGQKAATKASEAATVVGEEVLNTPEGETTEETTEETESGESDEETTAPELDPDALSGLDSYRTLIRMEWVPDEGDPEGTTMEQAHTRDPQAQRFVIEGGEGDDFEFVQIEEQAWYCAGGACSQAQADPEDLIAGFGEEMMFDPDDLADEASATFVGREEVNGVQSRHFRLDLSAMETALLAQGEVSDVESNVWIADESGLPKFTVRFEMTWNETREERSGSGELFYEVYDVNEPISIEPPEGAERSGLPEDVPTYPNAEDGFSMEGMTTFTSSDDVATVADFYAEELAAQGWSMAGEEDMGEDAVNQIWQKDERQLVLMITSEEGASNVTILIE